MHRSALALFFALMLLEFLCLPLVPTLSLFLLLYLYRLCFRLEQVLLGDTSESSVFTFKPSFSGLAVEITMLCRIALFSLGVASPHCMIFWMDSLFSLAKAYREGL